MVTIIERLKYLRQSKNFTQSYVAGEIGLSQQLYSYYESGGRKLPTEVIKELSRFYGVTAGYILGLEGDNETQEKADKFRKLSKLSNITRAEIGEGEINYERLAEEIIKKLGQ